MTGELLVALSKVGSTVLLLVKVVILLKYFMFMKYRTSDWRAFHFIYFSAKEIKASDEGSIKVKRIQNQLSIAFIILNLALVFVMSTK